jgi:predicted MFS family arabinose efflux permease
MFAIYLYLTLYMQNYLELSPLEAGLRYLPITIAIFLVSMVSGALLSRVHARVLIAVGLALTGAGLLLMSGVDADSRWTTLLAGFLIGGAGVGLLNPAIADVALSVVPPERSGMASGINDAFRQVGVAIGIAGWGALFQARGASQVSDLVPGTARADRFLAGFNDVLVAGGVLAIAGAVLALWLIREREIQREPLTPRVADPDAGAVRN